MTMLWQLLNFTAQHSSHNFFPCSFHGFPANQGTGMQKQPGEKNKVYKYGKYFAVHNEADCPLQSVDNKTGISP